MCRTVLGWENLHLLSTTCASLPPSQCRRSQAWLSTRPLYAGATPQQPNRARANDATTSACDPCLPHSLRAPVETAAAACSAVATHPAVRATAAVTVGILLLLYLLGALHRWATARVDLGR